MDIRFFHWNHISTYKWRGQDLFYTLRTNIQNLWHSTSRYFPFTCQCSFNAGCIVETIDMPSSRWPHHAHGSHHCYLYQVEGCIYGCNMNLIERTAYSKQMCATIFRKFPPSLDFFWLWPLCHIFQHLFVTTCHH